jgi:hypothetical protein
MTIQQHRNLLNFCIYQVKISRTPEAREAWQRNVVAYRANLNAALAAAKAA